MVLTPINGDKIKLFQLWGELVDLFYRGGYIVGRCHLGVNTSFGDLDRYLIAWRDRIGIGDNTALAIVGNRVTALQCCQWTDAVQQFCQVFQLLLLLLTLQTSVTWPDALTVFRKSAVGVPFASQTSKVLPKSNTCAVPVEFGTPLPWQVNTVVLP